MEKNSVPFPMRKLTKALKFVPTDQYLMSSQHSKKILVQNDRFTQNKYRIMIQLLRTLRNLNHVPCILYDYSSSLKLKIRHHLPVNDVARTGP